MNCTQDEFEKKVWAKYPAKHLSLEAAGADITIFALDTQYECSLPYFDRLKLADFVWRNGSVLKDTKGIFSSISVSTPTISFNGVPLNSGPISIQIQQSDDWVFTPAELEKSIKCICGSHSVGSNRHSSWCDIKGDT